MTSLIAGNINFTISVPPGSTNHGNPHLLCTPPKWYDFVIFFFSNYFAHAATVINRPGQHWTETLEVVLLALLWPISGVSRAMVAIFSHAATERDAIKRAARSSALCMVIRTAEKRDTGSKDDKNEWWDATLQWSDAGHLEKSKMRLHGSYRLKEGYCLALVPTGAAVSAPAGGPNVPHYVLASSYNIPKLLISFIQALWAVVTLYRTRGDQIEQFGYAAFGLTVAQYAFMSVFNIIGNLSRPEYPSLFMIRTPLMNEAEQAGCYFEGEIDVQIGEGESPRKLSEAQDREDGRQFVVGLLLGSTLLAIIGGLTGFQKRDSTPLERGFTMSWLVVSILFGPFGTAFHLANVTSEINARFSLVLTFTILFGTPAIGGMVVVGRMIHKFGICTLLG
jgi:hypothetical protein